jgi:hypothetical protein
MPVTEACFSSACLCDWEREREREKESARESERERERRASEKENEREREIEREPAALAGSKVKDITHARGDIFVNILHGSIQSVVSLLCLCVWVWVCVCVCVCVCARARVRGAQKNGVQKNKTENPIRWLLEDTNKMLEVTKKNVHSVCESTTQCETSVLFALFLFEICFFFFVWTRPR